VAVGRNGAIRHSSHGYSWTQVDSGTNADFKSVVWSGSAYVAVSSSRVFRSINGINWTEVTVAGAPELHHIFRRGNFICAVGSNGLVLRSANHGVSWSALSGTPAFHFFKGIAVSGGTLMNTSSGVYFWKSDGTWINGGPVRKALGEIGSTLLSHRGEIEFSADGESWSPLECSPVVGESGILVEFKGRHFLYTAGGAIHATEDTISFSYSSNGYAGAKEILSVDGVLYALGHYGMVAQSVDGVTWGIVYQNNASDLIRSGIVRGSEWLAVGEKGNIWRMDANGTIQVAYKLDGHSLRGIAASETTYVVVGAGGVIYYGEVEETSWQEACQPTTADLLAVSFGEGVFVAVGRNGTMLKSEDGVEWEEIEAITQQDLHSVIYSQNGWLVVGKNGTLLVSQDGCEWEMRDTGTTVHLNKVIANENEIYVLGESGFIQKSADLETWQMVNQDVSNFDVEGATFHEGKLVVALCKGLLEERITCSPSSSRIWVEALDRRFKCMASPSAALHALATIGDTLLAAGGSGAIRSSTDGRHWETRHLIPAGEIRALESTGDLCVIGGSGGLFYSSNGRDWHAAKIQAKLGSTCGFGSKDTIPNSDISSIVRGEGRWFAVGSGSFLISEDGMTWRSGVFPNGNTSLTGAAYGAGRIVVSTSGGKLFHSLNGESWSEALLPTGAKVMHLAWAGAGFISQGVGSYAGNSYQSADGTTWTQVTQGLGVVAVAMRRVDDRVFLLGNREGIFSSAEGAEWECHSMGSWSEPTQAYRSIIRFNNQYIVVGDGGLIATSPDGFSWTQEAGNIQRRFVGVSNVGDRFVILGSGTLFTTRDGRRITKHKPGDYPFKQVSRMAWSGSRAVIVGDAILTSSNLDDWTEVEKPVQDSLTHVSWDGSKFTAATSGGVKITSVDGLSWEAGGGTVDTTNPPTSFPDLPYLAGVAGVAESSTHRMAVYVDGSIMVSVGSESAAFRYDLMAKGAMPWDDLSMAGDANGDGLANLVAHYFGLPVTGSSGVGERQVLPSFRSSEDGSFLRFVLPNATPLYLELIVERSHDLQSWDAIARRKPPGTWSGAAPVSEKAAPGEGREIEVSVSPVAGSSAFYRVRVAEAQ
jgi:hypothetical protein